MSKNLPTQPASNEKQSLADYLRSQFEKSTQREVNTVLGRKLIEAALSKKSR